MMQGLPSWPAERVHGWLAGRLSGRTRCFPACICACLPAYSPLSPASLRARPHPLPPLPPSRYRLLLAGAGGPRGADALLNHVSFLHSQYQTLEDIPGGVEHMAEAQQVGWGGALAGV